jgi:hypothetical protein
MQGCRAAWLAPVLLAGLLALAACSSTNNKTNTNNGKASAATITVTPTPTASLAQAQTQLCSSLSALGTALEPLKNLGSGATLTQVLASRAAVKTAWADVMQAAKQVANFVTADLQAALDKLDQTVNGIQNGDDLLAKAQSILDAGDAVLTALTSVKTAAKC